MNSIQQNKERLPGPMALGGPSQRDQLDHGMQKHSSVLSWKNLKFYVSFTSETQKLLDKQHMKPTQFFLEVYDYVLFQKPMYSYI